ncbi:MAG: ribonuclease III [Alicyclobacillaceae bacterium]|nr:ribonuclease III [Alicyclobacillaceae bacterium]
MKPGWSVSELSPLALAFVGDAVWELYIRNHVLSRGVRRSRDLHQKVVRYVRADTQAELIDHLMDVLTAEEQDVVRRGRNAKPGHSHRGGDVLTYRHSTGFEALLGYLYGRGQTERLQELCSLAVGLLDREESRRPRTDRGERVKTRGVARTGEG